ncbi:MAG: cupin domain-containing protein [Deltaproteobacteria bacterium]|nr:cupin domain-containing protein [Deltaproteobacteria bacterium]
MSLQISQTNYFRPWQKKRVRIERIISDGHATPPGEWYEQGWDEWVLLVSGEATLLFDDSSAPFILKPGDHIMIPAGCRHRVEQTDPLAENGLACGSFQRQER